ncbi:MAG TPA: hypothetical protein VLA54_06745 [Acidimicrobiia bacterium]|nr:hypothetical protein [Acidimicrobiia bacterium]
MAERRTSVSITRSGLTPPSPVAVPLGAAAAGVLEYLIQVVDREDRLESGSGRFREDLAADHDSRKRAVEEAVLRLLRLAADPLNYRILEGLTGEAAFDASGLASLTGLPRLSIEERVADLVSAGLAAKVAGGRVAVTGAGMALVGLIREAVAAGSTQLGRE